jgi:putative ABC transport system substrate-binding protein
MRRREFITILGSAASWPLLARAQQAERMRRIGMLMPSAADDPRVRTRIAVFLHELQELSWTDGRNVRIDYCWSGGRRDRVRECAVELAATAPDVILAPGSAALGPALQATRTVPIVFVHVPDPVGNGFVKSLARPGGNATGVLAEFPSVVDAVQSAAEVQRALAERNADSDDDRCTLNLALSLFCAVNNKLVQPWTLLSR